MEIVNRKSIFLFVNLHLLTKFAAIPFHSDGSELLLFTKGVIEIIFIDEILAKFLSTEGNRQ